MVGSDEEGDFSLDVYPVMLDDDAKYQCQVGPGASGAYQIYHLPFFLFLFISVSMMFRSRCV